MGGVFRWDTRAPTSICTAFRPELCLRISNKRCRRCFRPRSLSRDHLAWNAAPVGSPGHVVDRNLAEKAEFLAIDFNALDQGLQVRWVTVRSD
jgi:hypothetical protein